MKAIFYLENGTKAIFNTETDSCIFADRRGLEHTRGIDLYMHITEKGQRIFYKLVWSLYVNDPNFIKVISEEEAQKILEQKFPQMTKEDIKVARQVFPDCCKETA